jgi:hypothetical protein
MVGCGVGVLTETVKLASGEPEERRSDANGF